MTSLREHLTTPANSPNREAFTSSPAKTDKATPKLTPEEKTEKAPAGKAGKIAKALKAAKDAREVKFPVPPEAPPSALVEAPPQ